MEILKYKDENGVMQPLYEIYKPDPFNGYEYVDMGEAGYWATCNIGATKPEDTGLLFQWGATKGYKPDDDIPQDLNWYDDIYSKYNNLNVLLEEDDAARVNMGGGWRIPSPSNFRKLIELCNTNFINNYKDSGINGVLLTLKEDETKSVFFPKSGYFYKVENNLDSYGINNQGYYRTTDIGDYGYLDIYSDTLFIESNNISVSDLYDDDSAVKAFFPIRAFIPKSE